MRSLITTICVWFTFYKERDLESFNVLVLLSCLCSAIKSNFKPHPTASSDWKSIKKLLTNALQRRYTVIFSMSSSYCPFQTNCKFLRNFQFSLTFGPIRFPRSDKSSTRFTFFLKSVNMSFWSLIWRKLRTKVVYNRIQSQYIGRYM